MDIASAYKYISSTSSLSLHGSSSSSLLHFSFGEIFSGFSDVQSLSFVFQVVIQSAYPIAWLFRAGCTIPLAPAESTQPWTASTLKTSRSLLLLTLAQKKGLHLAAWAGQAQAVSYLCKQKADVGAAAMDDMGAIHFAAQKGHLEVVRTLLSSRSFRSHLEVIKVLLKKGASLDAKTKAGKTPLDLAVTEEIRSLLKEREQAPEEVNTGGKRKVEQPDSSRPPLDKPENSNDEATAAEHDGQEEESVKRKGDDNKPEGVSEPKKPRVVLKHLSEDDTQEDDDT
ncbi:hypothetical protein GOBAR_DD03068 [Gossypium barbadense]|nr:hypothetical protein GOBAR_DD03068 [Gossypium barbadense]